VALVDGAIVIALGVAFMVLLEGEKVLLRRYGFLEETRA
jgi:hypothetical protein